MRLRRGITAGLAALVVLAVALVWAGPGLVPERGSHVAVLTIEGPISGGSAGGLLGSVSAGSGTIVEALRRAREDPSVAGVVLRLDTPGGSAAAAQEIGVEVERLRRAGKPIVASIGELAASGGYWIAALSDEIVANPASLTGSIGVIMNTTNFTGLYDRLGVEVDPVKSGPYKDIGSPARPMTPEERAILEEMVNDLFDQFVDVVARGRRLPRERVLRVADGRLFTGRQALTLGLVDRLGNYQDALDRAAQLAGLGRDYEVRPLVRQPFWQGFVQGMGAAIGRGAAGAFTGYLGPTGTAGSEPPPGSGGFLPAPR